MVEQRSAISLKAFFYRQFLRLMKLIPKNRWRKYYKKFEDNYVIEENYVKLGNIWTKLEFLDL